MKHADLRASTLLELLLDDIRNRAGLIKKKPGIFYRKSKAFLHFHEDKMGLFMNLRDGNEWLRLSATEY